MSARFLDPCAVERKLSGADYVVGAPDRGRGTRVCHLGVLELCHVGDGSGSVGVPPVAAVGVAVPSSQVLGRDGDVLDARGVQRQAPRVSNSDVGGPFEFDATSECRPET